MSKAMSILGSVLFFVAAPVVVAGLVPWWIMRWEFQPAFLGFEVTRVIGVMLIIAGIPGLVGSFARFALQGLGTPAPIAPTQNLVVTGLYRYLRPTLDTAADAMASRMSGRDCLAHASFAACLPAERALIGCSSMDGKGAWRDNVFVERFWRTIK